MQQLDGPVQIAMESTGHYWMPLYEYLLDRDYAVTVFNPLQIQAYRRVGVRKAKTDRIDSYFIADFLRIRPPHAVIVPPPQRRQLRHLARFRFTLVDRNATLRRRGHMLLDQVFPEYPSLFARPFQTTSRALLRQAVAAEAFRTWPLAELTATIRRASRGRLGEEKAQAIQAAAQTLDPTVHRSGLFSASETHLSKRGSTYLRRAIWLAAMPARRYNPDLEAFYQRKRRQGKHHNVAMAALCHRLLARIFVIL